MLQRPNDSASRAQQLSGDAPQLWRWKFIEPGPPLTAALLMGEALKSATTRLSCDLGHGLLPNTIYRDNSPDHRHAFWLPGDDDGDGLIDHAWVCAANGFPRAVIEAFVRVEFVRIFDTRYALAPSWMSPLIAGGPFGPSSVWRAVTPYVTPKWRLNKKGKERAAFTPEAQLCDEIDLRGLSPPASIAWSSAIWIGEELVSASSFFMNRRKGGVGLSPPADALASFPTITFCEPVDGPLAFGFGAHFGLGMMLPGHRQQQHRYRLHCGAGTMAERANQRIHSG